MDPPAMFPRLHVDLGLAWGVPPGKRRDEVYSMIVPFLLVIHVASGVTFLKPAWLEKKLMNYNLHALRYLGGQVRHDVSLKRTCDQKWIIGVFCSLCDS